MSRKSLTTPFRTIGNQPGLLTPVNCTDTPVGVANPVGRSSGAYTETPALLGGPQQNQNWKLQSLAINAYLSLYGVNAPTNQYGQWGKISGALLLDPILPNVLSNVTNWGNQAPWIQQAQQIPDATLVFDLWDPATDNMPPQFPAVNNSYVAGIPPSQMLHISGSLLPATPIDLVPGKPPSAAILMEPSIMGQFGTGFGSASGLVVSYGEFTLGYDDGL